MDVLVHGLGCTECKREVSASLTGADRDIYEHLLSRYRYSKRGDGGERFPEVCVLFGFLGGCFSGGAPKKDGRSVTCAGVGGVQRRQAGEESAHAVTGLWPGYPFCANERRAHHAFVLCPD